MLIQGSGFSLKADSVILALGERAELSFLPEGMRAQGGLIAIDTWGRTNLRGVFAGGDAATGAGYVSQAIASGKRGALAIDQYLQGKGENPEEDRRGKGQVRPGSRR